MIRKTQCSVCCCNGTSAIAPESLGTLFQKWAFLADGVEKRVPLRKKEVLKWALEPDGEEFLAEAELWRERFFFLREIAAMTNIVISADGFCMKGESEKIAADEMAARIAEKMIKHRD